MVERTEFPSHTLILLALEQTNGKNLKNSLKEDLYTLCSDLLPKQDIFVCMDFRPYGDGWYSRQFGADVGFLRSCGRLDERVIYKSGGNEILYFTDTSALEELANAKSSMWYANEKPVPIEIREKVKQIVKEYYQTKYSSAK